MRTHLPAAATLLGIVLLTEWPSPAAAGTSFELLRGWGYNKDETREKERTTLTVMTFQPWKYGAFFVYFNIVEPFRAPGESLRSNEKGGISGGLITYLSIKKIGEKLTGGQPWAWGALTDLSLYVEVDDIANFTSLTYAGAAFDIKVPHFSMFQLTAVARQDWALSGVDLQLGGFWQAKIPVATWTELQFGGGFQWGVFGEGKGVRPVGLDEKGQYVTAPAQGRPFFITQPQLLVDIGRLLRLDHSTLFAGIRYQLAWNRRLQQGVTEHVPQLLFRWNL